LSGSVEGRSSGPWLRLLVLLGLLAAGGAALRFSGLAGRPTLENLQALAAGVRSLGWLGPAGYVLLWVVACLFFVPGLPITLAGAAVFGAWQGLLWVTVGANLGAMAAFLAGRYAARPLVEGWTKKNPRLARIETGVRQHGWRMVMITRLVPVFPFSLQNYAYGLTPIRFGTYALVTFLCMLPASVALCFAGGALVSGGGNLRRTLGYLGAAAIVFAVASLIPGWVKRRYGAENPAELR
jgi:uncharacterized membrane protein YdjX (TVP38/TMEM64 family)